MVKEKSKAREAYSAAVNRGESAGLLEQAPESSDVFSTRLGNIAKGESVRVEITYVGELKHDAEADGIRYTLPTAIAPRYGAASLAGEGLQAQENGGIKITIDACMAKGAFIQGIQSPTHPIAVALGKTSTSSSVDDPVAHQASVTLSLGTSELDKDFVVIVQTQDSGIPRALMEIHPIIPNQRALMATLVPNFSLPPIRPEIIFVVDRSGSMSEKIANLKEALKVFLKSLPVGIKFNICSFGSHYSFLWEKSRIYSQLALDEALSHVESFAANFGGTKTFNAIKASLESRFEDLPCQLMLLTDGQISNQTEIFNYLNKEVQESKAGIRVFTLGIGSSVSHALVEGIARAGNGFGQTVGENEKLDKKVVRMLKGALSPPLTDIKLEVKYETAQIEEEDFELVDEITPETEAPSMKSNTPEADQKPILFFDADKKADEMEIAPSANNATADPYSHLPTISTPKLLRTPSNMPSLFPFSRNVVYLLLSEKSIQENPSAVILRAKCSQGPLELEIPIETVSTISQTIHQLAARNILREFEEGRGWLFDHKNQNGISIKNQFPGHFDEIVEREAVRLGTQFQVSGKWLAFVAVSENGRESLDGDYVIRDKLASDWLTVTKARSKRRPHSLLPKLHSKRGRHSCRRGDVEPSAPNRYPKDADTGAGYEEGWSQTFNHASILSSYSPYLNPLANSPASRTSHSQCNALVEPYYSHSTPDPSAYAGFPPHGSRIATAMPKQNLIFGALQSSGALQSVQQKSNHMSKSIFSSFGADPVISPKARLSAELSNSEKVHAVIGMQNFEGSWDFSKRLADITGIGKESFEQQGAGKVWVTVLVIAFLELCLGEEHDIWELVVEKAKLWLSGQNIELDAVEEEGRRVAIRECGL